MSTATKATHTPGPWTASSREQNSNGFTYTPIYGARRKIANVAWHGFRDGSEGDANARLIAQAPELGNCLKQIISDLPTRRDWLDPVLEGRAIEALQKAGLL